MEEMEWESGSVNLKIGGEPVEMQFTVPKNPVKPQRMLPIFHQMTNALVGVSVEIAEGTGKTVSCKAGCGACCRQPVPITEIEAYQLAELVDGLPEPKRSEIRQKFDDGFSKFSEMDWFERVRTAAKDAFEKDTQEAHTRFGNVALEYFHAGVACPFLENESCGIHPSRPLACREYLVSSPAENCSDPDPTNIDRIGLMLKPSVALREVAKTENTKILGGLTMIGALSYVQEFPEQFEQRPGREWMGEFFNALSDEKPKEPVKTIRRKNRTKRTKR